MSCAQNCGYKNIAPARKGIRGISFEMQMCMIIFKETDSVYRKYTMSSVAELS